jgi:hypothetical protein
MGKFHTMTLTLSSSQAIGSSRAHSLSNQSHGRAADAEAFRNPKMMGN